MPALPETRLMTFSVSWTRNRFMSLRLSKPGMKIIIACPFRSYDVSVLTSSKRQDHRVVIKTAYTGETTALEKASG